MGLKHLVTASILIMSGSAATSAIASDFGCQALLCFAGGKNVSECKPTIKKVIKDMSRGKSFPHCSLVNSSGQETGGTGDIIQVSQYRERWGSGVCRDGETRPYRKNKKWYCNTIEFNVKPQYAADKSHQQQFYNWN